MEEIKVGEYVKDKDGVIGKVKKIAFDDESLEEYCYFEKKWMGAYKKDIVKHRPNIIDLIEVGNYVNGYKVSDKEGTLLITNVKGIDRSGYHIPISQYGDGIETILTKEQYQANCYKVGGEE